MKLLVQVDDCRLTDTLSSSQSVYNCSSLAKETYIQAYKHITQLHNIRYIHMYIYHTITNTTWNHKFIINKYENKVEENPVSLPDLQEDRSTIVLS